MQYRTLGASGVNASVVGFGAWAIGGWMWGGVDEAAAIAAIHAGIDAGMCLIDTAPVYGFGTSETIVGKAIRGRRDKVVLATKCGLVWHLAKGQHFFNSDEHQVNQESDEHSVYRYLGPDSIAYEIEQSLKRLGVETIDLYQTHWQEETTPIGDTMAALLKLKEQGKIRAIGVSNATPEQMDQYGAKGVVDSDQERFSMLDRGHEAAQLPYVAEHNIAYLAYSPLAQGMLTGKIGPDRTFADGDQRQQRPRYSVENRQKVAALLDEFAPIAAAHDITLAQLTIAWTVHQPGCTHALVGARNPAQALENAAAGDVELSAAELETMRQAIGKHTPEIA